MLWLRRQGGLMLRPFLDVVLPPRCVVCGTVVQGENGLCAGCFRGFQFLYGSLCSCCGGPRGDGEQNGVCLHCQASPPLYTAARSLFVYDEASRGLILRFKHGDRSDLAAPLARWLLRVGHDLLASSDVVVPVPLHWSRLFHRRYNQSALLARRLTARASGLSYAPRDYAPLALARVRATQSQGEFDEHGHAREQRHHNVAGAFAIRQPRRIAGKRVLLVDDVLTTGATLEECTRTLLSGGATAVNVLTLARAVLR